MLNWKNCFLGQAPSQRGPRPGAENKWPLLEAPNCAGAPNKGTTQSGAPLLLGPALATARATHKLDTGRSWSTSAFIQQADDELARRLARGSVGVPSGAEPNKLQDATPEATKTAWAIGAREGDRRRRPSGEEIPRLAAGGCDLLLGDAHRSL